MCDTVVLVPGLGLGGAEMALLAKRLRRRGYCTRIFWHSPWRHSLADKAALLHRFVAALDGRAVHFVAHSFGGLLVLQLFNDYPHQRPGRIVMLGVPVNGSLAARSVAKWPLGHLLLGGYAAPGPAGAHGRLLPGREVGGIAGKVNLVFGWLFGLAWPNDTLVSAEEALHDDMRDTVVLTVSHSSMLLSGRVMRCVDSFLKTGAFAGYSQRRTRGS
jgi:pimeloyl-ACP methyl ester carboxylesterase